MALIDELRKELPEYAGMADHDIVSAVSHRLGEDPSMVAHELGVQISDPGFFSSLKGGLASYPAGAGRALEDAGLEGIGRGLRQYGEDVQFRNPSSVTGFADFTDRPWQGFKEFAGSAVGSSLPALVPYVGPAARALGGATAIAGAGMAAIPAYGQIREQQEATGQTNIPGAALGALATGAIEQLGGVQNMLRPAAGRTLANGLSTDLLKQMGTSPLRTFARQGLRVAGEEGLEELAQQPIQQFAGGQDPTSAESLGDTAFSGFAGFVGSLPFGGLSGGRRALQQRSSQGFVDQTLTNPEAPRDARMDAVLMQQQFGGLGADWAENMRLGIQDDFNRMRAAQLAQGAPLNLLDVQNDVSALEQYQPLANVQPQGSIFDTINQNQGVVQALPHAAPAMPVGTQVDDPTNRAASIYAALAASNPAPQSQEAVDLDWATQQLKQSMSPQAFAAFQTQVAMESAGQKAKAPPKAAPAAVTSQAGVPSGPAAAAPQTFGGAFKASGGRVSNVVKALDQAKSPDEALEVVRQWIEKPNIASSTLRALEELHKKISGKTYEQHLREQEAADAGQSVGGQVVPQGVGQAQGAQPGTAVQPQGAAGQRPAQPNREESRAVSTAAKRAQLAETVVKSLRPEDQEVLGFLQQHGDKAYERLGQKLGITRQAARQRVHGVRDREGNVKQLGILDRIANIVAAKGLTMEDVLKAYKPRVFESDEARTGLSPKLNESHHEEEALNEESAAVQSTGTIASPGGAQSNIYDTEHEKRLAEQVPGYADKVAEERNQQADESAQELIPAAQGEKVDDRIVDREEATADYTAASQWWETERDNVAEIPKFDDLSDRHQEEVIEAVKHNEANGRLQKRVIAEFNEPSYYSRGKALGGYAQFGNPLGEGEIQHAGVQRALKQLREGGLFGLLDLARSIYVSRGMQGVTNGLFIPHEDRSFSIALSHTLFTGPYLEMAHVLRHELAHGMDFVLGAYSGSGDMIEIVVPEIEAVGKRGGQLAEYMQYPLDRAAHEIQDDVEYRAEMFAQLQSAWLTEFGRGLIQREAPRTAAFMRSVNEHAKAELRRKTGVQGRAQEGAEQGRAAGQGQVGRVLRHTAFHGTPHDVHENGGFTTQKIGSGEGAQAYGWGLYFSSMKEIARWYRNKLTPKEQLVDRNGEPVQPQGLAYRFALRYNDLDTAIARAEINQKNIDGGAEGGFGKIVQQLKEWKAQGVRKQFNEGRVYTVELAPELDEYLDWDKPLSKQSDSVQQAIEKTGLAWRKETLNIDNALGWMVDYIDNNAAKYGLAPDDREVEHAIDAWMAEPKPFKKLIEEHGFTGARAQLIERMSAALKRDQTMWGEEPGSSFYTRLAKRAGGQMEGMPKGVTRPDFEAASKRLLAAGIPGITYEGRTSSERNYVIFDDKHVTIKSYENRGKSIESFKDSLKQMPDQELAETEEMLKEARAKGDKTANERWLAARVERQARQKSRLFRDVQERYGSEDDTPGTLHNRGTTVEALERAQERTVTTLSDLWAKAKPTLLTLHQLVDQFGDKMAGLKAYTLSMDKMEQRHQEVLNRAHRVIMDWQKLPTRTRESLNQLMQRATLRGVHPDEPFGTGPNDHLTDQSEYDSLKARYDALSHEAKATYKAVRKLLDENWEARKAAFSRSTTAAYQKLIDEAAGDQKRVASLTKERDKLISDHERAIADIKGPYFPLLRIGDYLTIAKSKELAQLEQDLEDATGEERTALRKRIDAMKRDGNHYSVEAYENRFEAEASAAQHKSRGMDARAQLAEQHLRQLQPLAAGAIDKIASSISDQFDKQTAAKMKQLVTELYISSLPEHAALQRQLKRKGIEGASQDMLRAVAKAVEKDAFYLARLEFADEIADNLFKVKMEAKKAGIDAQHVYNNLAARLALDFEWRSTPIQSALARLSGIWHLGMSPAYLLTNATQPWMITAPVLAGRFGAGRAFSALRDAWVDAARIIKQSKADGAFADIDFKGVADAQEREMLERIVQRGQIDITQNVDMGLVADGVDPKFLKLQKAFNWTNQHIEASNRITTAIASYRLARQRGMAHDDAAEFAYKLVVDTQLDYSNANAAYWMKNGAVPLGKLIFQFRKYQQGMLYLMARNAQLAFKGDKDALRALGYLAAMQLAMAGAVGIPVVTAPLAALGLFIGGGDDEKGDLETQLRNYLTDVMGADAARAFWKGLPTMLGLDVSQRLGMGDMWKPLPFLRLTGKTGSDDMAQLLLQTLGAPFGTLASFWDAAKFAKQGDWQKSTEKLLPKMLADPLRASRYAGQGLTTRSGTQVLTPEKIDGWDIAFRAAGFSPTVESEHYAAQASKENAAQAIAERRNNVLAQYANAKMRGDDTAAELEAINRFNQDHPDRGFRIDRSSMLKSVQSRRKSAGTLDEAGVKFTKQQRSLRGVDRYAI